MNEYTVGHVIDAFREILRQVSDDSVFTDEFLYYILSVARAAIIKNTLDGNKDLSPWLYQRFCVKLCPSTFIECNCQPFDFACTVYRSEKPIPKPIWDTQSSVINVSELWGDSILPVRETANRVAKYKKYKHPMYYIIGDNNGEKYLYVISNKVPPRYIKIEGVFEDPSLIDQIACKDEECPNPLGMGFPMDLHKHLDLIKISMELITPSLKTPEDRSNNSQSTVKEVTI
jgi:hypothetical protein